MEESFPTSMREMLPENAVRGFNPLRVEESFPTFKKLDEEREREAKVSILLEWRRVFRPRPRLEESWRLLPLGFNPLRVEESFPTQATSGYPKADISSSSFNPLRMEESFPTSMTASPKRRRAVFRFQSS